MVFKVLMESSDHGTSPSAPNSCFNIHVEYAEKFLQIICENYYSRFSLNFVFLFRYLGVDDGPV